MLGRSSQLDNGHEQYKTHSEEPGVRTCQEVEEDGDTQCRS